MITQDKQVTMVEGKRLQTFQRSYAQILAGDDPWLPLGNMMHQFFGGYKQFRAELVHIIVKIVQIMCLKATEKADEKPSAFSVAFRPS